MFNYLIFRGDRSETDPSSITIRNIEMREINHIATTSKIGFELGFDLFRYGGYESEDALSLKDVQDGYNAAKIQNTHTLRSQDKFDRKLIQIRARAYKKGILVTITKADLRAVLKECKSICPVIFTPLTFATGEESDWSVDRVDNNRGYEPGNIMIMSSLANQAKGNMELEDIMRYVLLSSESEQGFNKLDFDKWQNLMLAIYDRMPSERLAQILKESLFGNDVFIRTFMIHILMTYVDVSSQSRHLKLMMTASILCDLFSDGALTSQDAATIRKVMLKVTRRRLEINGQFTPETLQDLPYYVCQDKRGGDAFTRLISLIIDAAMTDENYCIKVADDYFSKFRNMNISYNVQ